MIYLNVYFSLLFIALVVLMVAPFVPRLRKLLLDNRHHLDQDPFVFYIGLLELMDNKDRRNDFLGAIGLAALYIFSIFFAMLPPALVLLAWPLFVLVLLVAVPFYLILSDFSKKSPKEVSKEDQ